MSQLLFLLLCTAFVGAQGITTKRNYIRIDQFGYLPNAKKVAVIANAQVGFNSSYGINLNTGANVQLRRASDNAVVKQSLPTAWNGGAREGLSGDIGWWWDFSDVTTEGEYYIRITENGGNTVNSNRFRIAGDVYTTVLKKAVNMLYYQRCDTDKNGNFASGNQWTDGKWYTKDANTKALDNAGYTRDLRGGWIDAGDPNKYVTFATPVVHALLTSYEQHPGLWDNLSLDLPESGNNVPDLLDEVKFEVDWIMRMQDTNNGGVHQKMGIVGDKGYRDPPSTDDRDRWFEDICVNSTITASGMFAHMAKVLYNKGILNSYADDLSGRAIQAWNYYENSNNKGENCDPNSGRRVEAGDGDGPLDNNGIGQYSKEVTAEAVTAAIYLYDLTGQAKYNNFVKNNYREMRPFKDAGVNEWDEYRSSHGEALLYYAQLPNADATVKQAILDLKNSNNKANSNNNKVVESESLYRAKNLYLAWGSTSLMSRTASDQMDYINYGLRTNLHDQYRERASAFINFIHGVNPFGIVFISNMYGEGAEYCADEMWHTWTTDGSPYDGIGNGRVGPPPGFLSGGINSNLNYTCRMQVGTNKFSGVFTSSQPEMKRWSMDNQYFADSNPWAFNEPAIYYNASYIKALASLIADGGSTTPPPPPSFTNAIRNLNGPGSFSPGGNMRITFDYESAGNFDVVAQLQYNGTPNYSSVAPVIRRQVSAGTGSFTFDLKPRADTPVRNDGYQVTVYLTERGQNWADRKDFKQIRNVDCIAAPTFQNVVRNLSAPNSFNPGGNFRATIDYESAGDHDVVAVLQYDGDPNYSWVASSIRRQVSAGTGSLTFDLKPRANTPVRNDAYQVNIFLTKRGKGWGDRFSNKVKKNLDCVAAAPSTSNDWVYTDNLRAGWANWSWNGTTTVRDAGVARVGTYAFKHLANGNGGAASMRHDVGKDASAANLKEVGFFVRSWNSNWNTRFQARWNDSDGGPRKTIAVTPNWKYVTVSKADLGTDWIQRMIWTVPANKTIFLDNVRLVYYTNAQGIMTQHVGDELSPALGTDIIKDATLNIYPNPNQGVFTMEMELPTSERNLSVRLIDLNGRIADQISVNAAAGHNLLQMDYRDGQLPRGIYMLQVASPDGGVQLMRRVSIQ